VVVSGHALPAEDDAEAAEGWCVARFKIPLDVVAGLVPHSPQQSQQAQPHTPPPPPQQQQMLEVLCGSNSSGGGGGSSSSCAQQQLFAAETDGLLCGMLCRYDVC
jgi:hypothetical protein